MNVPGSDKARLISLGHEMDLGALDGVGENTSRAVTAAALTPLSRVAHNYDMEQTTRFQLEHGTERLIFSHPRLGKRRGYS